jgi:starvation-inducible DNA-binding protein
MKPALGIADDARKEIAEGLGRLLADTYTLQLKTHQYHWNVTGPMFQTLHLMFMTQYQELWTATDEIAERIRALGEFAPGSYRAFVELSSIEEDAAGAPPPALEMVRNLVEGHEATVLTARTIFPIAEEANDQSTCDLLTQRMQIGEKTAWMLRSLLE